MERELLVIEDKVIPLERPRGGDGLRGGAVSPTVNEASALSTDEYRQPPQCSPAK